MKQNVTGNVVAHAATTCGRWQQDLELASMGRPRLIENKLVLEAQTYGASHLAD